MGACISSDIHKISKHNQTQIQNQHMDYSSVIDEKPSVIVTRPMPLDLAVKYRLSSAKFRSFGSNEDVFFESQPWLESDGDDEFYSVNGDSTTSITSSACNTPIHKSLSATPFRHSEDISVGYKLTLSPVRKRKSLSELFKEDEEEENAISNHEYTEPHFPQQTDVKVKKERSQKSTHHCFPRIFSVHSPDMTKKNSIVAA